MEGLRRKRFFQQILYSKPMLGVLLGVLILSANAAWGMYQKYAETADNRARAERELKRLRDREKTIQEEVKRLNTEAGVEEEIRENLGLVKSGEELIVIVEPREDRQENTNEKDGILNFIWQSIRSIF